MDLQNYAFLAYNTYSTLILLQGVLVQSFIHFFHQANISRLVSYYITLGKNKELFDCLLVVLYEHIHFETVPQNYVPLIRYWRVYIMCLFQPQ